LLDDSVVRMLNHVDATDSPRAGFYAHHQGEGSHVGPWQRGLLGGATLLLVLGAVVGCAVVREEPRELVTVWDPYFELGPSSMWSESLEQCADETDVVVERLSYRDDELELQLEDALINPTSPDILVFPSEAFFPLVRGGVLAAPLTTSFAPTDIPEPLSSSGEWVSRTYAVPMLLRFADEDSLDAGLGAVPGDMLAVISKPQRERIPELAQCLLSPEVLAGLAAEQEAVASTWAAQTLQTTADPAVIPLVDIAQDVVLDVGKDERAERH